jgi:hypothetical protein
MVVRTPNCTVVIASVSAINFSEHSLFSIRLHSAYQSDSNAVATSMCVALHRIRTTIIPQLFGVSESAVPCDMQNYFEY